MIRRLVDPGPRRNFSVASKRMKGRRESLLALPRWFKRRDRLPDAGSHVAAVFRDVADFAPFVSAISLASDGVATTYSGPRIARTPCARGRVHRLLQPVGMRIFERFPCSLMISKRSFASVITAAERRNPMWVGSSASSFSTASGIHARWDRRSFKAS